jgi:hypothetical protein
LTLMDLRYCKMIGRAGLSLQTDACPRNPEVIPPRHGEGDHAKHGGGAPAGCRNLAVMPGRNAAPI